jgi:hypothetical protein
MSNYSNYSNYPDGSDTSKRENLIIANLIIAGTGVLLLVLLLALLVLHRAYQTVLQRLFLYFITATALHNVVINIQLHFSFYREFCGWVGFCNVWTANLLDLLNFSFTVYLIATTYQRFKGERLPCLGCCRRHPVLTEVLCVVTVILLPLSYLGFIYRDCCVRRQDDDYNEVWDYEDCDEDYRALIITDLVDPVLQFTSILSFLVLMMIISMLARQKKFVAVGRAVFLIMMVSLSISISVVLVLIDLDVIMPHPIVHACGHILSNLFVILGVGAYLYSPRKLSIKSLRRAAGKWTCCERFRHYRQLGINTNPSGIADDDDLVSAEISVEQDIPSNTIALTAPYTNGFTDITEIVNSHCTTNYGTIQ